MKPDLYSKEMVMDNSPVKYKCPLCKDSGEIRYKPLDWMTHYGWTRWYTRPCICQSDKIVPNDKSSLTTTVK